MSTHGNPNYIVDYIVVGTGPSGAILANRLSEDRRNSVLVIEAGDNNTNELPISVPSTETWKYFPWYFWQGRSVPQIHANGKMFNWTSGRTLGGGSSVNGNQYVRPTPQVLSKWERLMGPMWSYQQALACYMQIEKFNGLTNNIYAHGYNGRLDIRQTPTAVPTVTRKLVDAMIQGTGFPVIQDYNNPETPFGAFYQWQLYQQPDGKRDSAATAFLSSDVMTPEGYGVDGRQLRILMEASALRVILNQRREAIGLEFLQDGWQQTAFARKEVIISAGFNSSQLLMLSGIGPSDRLEAAGIPVVLNNPNVGRNLVNHPLYAATFTINPMDLEEKIDDPLALYNGGAFLPYPFSDGMEGRGVQLIGMVQEGKLQLLALDLQPVSSGEITIQNNDPLKIVLADYNYLGNDLDIDKAKSIFRNYILPIAQKLTAIDPSYQLVSPSYDVIQDDKKLEQFLRSNLGFDYHEQSSNRMAPLDQGGVVDPFGRVYGVDHLIVADTSIIPYTVDANTSATSYFIGYNIANQLLYRDYVINQYPY